MPALVPLRRALRRASFAIWTVALTYALSVATGMVLVHSGHRPSLDYGDRLVGQAYRDSPILHQLQSGHRLMAAALDAAGNAFGGLASMAAGYCPPVGYGATAYRGWIGGTMSVDSDHHSRLARPYDASTASSRCSSNCSPTHSPAAPVSISASPHSLPTAPTKAPV